MSNIICNNIVSSGNITVTGDFVLGTSNLNTLTVNSRSVFNGILNCGTLNINGAITQTGAVGFTSGSGKINLQGDVEILGNKSFTTGTGTININGILNLSNVTPSTGWTTGAVTIQGGLGVFGNINGGENISCVGSLSVYGDSISLKNGENYLYVNTENDISITGGRNMYVQTGGQPRLFINSTGLVGVGTLTPSEKLEIIGDVYINNPTSKLYLSNKNSYLSVDSSQMTLKTFGDISIEAGEIMGSIYMNQNVICSGTTESKYYWATDGFPITSQLSNGSYLSFNNFGLEETNLTNSSSALGGGGFYFHKKSPEFATSKLLMSITGDGNVGIGTSTTSYNYLTIQNTNNTLASNSPDGGGYHGLNLVSTKTGTTPYSMALGVDYTSGIGYINAGGNATTQPICLNTRGGNVGIGTSTPTAKLNVNGDTVLDGGLKINSESTPISTVFYNNGAGSGVGNQFRLVRVNGTKTTPLNVNSGDLIGTVQAQGYDTTTGNHVRSSSIAFYANQNYTSSTTNGGYLTFETTADNVGFTPTERLRVTANGDIGIGTTTPTTKLDVVGDIKSSSSIISPYLFAQGKSNFLGQSLGQGSYWSWNSSNGQGETNFVNVFNTGNFGGFTFSTKAPSSTSSTNLMRILEDGKVGIGTDTPAYKLDVSGSIQANRFTSKNGWNSSYVYNFTQNEIFTDFQGLDTNIYLGNNYGPGCYLISFNIILHRNTADVHLKGFNIRIGTEPNFTDVYEYLDTSDETLIKGKYKTITFFDTYYKDAYTSLYLSYRNSIAETEILQVYKGYLKITKVY